MKNETEEKKKRPKQTWVKFDSCAMFSFGLCAFEQVYGIITVSLSLVSPLLQTSIILLLSSILLLSLCNENSVSYAIRRMLANLYIGIR